MSRKQRRVRKPKRPPVTQQAVAPHLPRNQARQQRDRTRIERMKVY